MGLSATLACSKLAVLGGKEERGWVRKRAGFVQVMTIHSSSSLCKNLNPHDVVVVYSVILRMILQRSRRAELTTTEQALTADFKS